MRKIAFSLMFVLLCSVVYAQQLDEVPAKIIGKGQMSAKEMADFLLSKNPRALDVLPIAQFYVQESEYEQVNHDLAFAQMCLETGFLRFNGMVPRKSNNFCGFGAFSGNTPNSFDSPQEGVRAQIQHLKAYATNVPIATPFSKPLIDPRYNVLQEKNYIGSAQTVFELTGKWATDPEYGNKIIAIAAAMYQFAHNNRNHHAGL
jgi:hypothetical protein